MTSGRFVHLRSLAGGAILGAVATASLTGLGLVRTTAAAAQTSRSASDEKTWAPQFPRPGATKVFENEHIVVWDQVYADEPFMHRHIRDEFNILMEDGPIKVMDEKGQVRISPHVGATGKPGMIGYFKAGLGPHAEWAVDPDHRPRAIYVEIKGTEPAALVDGRWPKQSR